MNPVPSADRPRHLLFQWLVPTGLVLVALYALPSLIPLPTALSRPPEPGIVFTDRNNQPLRELREEDDRYHRTVALADISPALINATLSAEDKRFWSHPGFDPVAILRAASGGIRHHRIISGASTITQQLIKISDPRPRTFTVKVRETLEAIHLERKWTKSAILEAYLNRLDYGNSRVGCAAAAAYYLGKPAHDLSPAEAAFLAAIPQAPTRLNPYVALPRVEHRQGWILRRMAENGYLSAPELNRALQEPIRLRPPVGIFEAPHFIDQVLRTFRDEPSLPSSCRTTLDLELNHEATRLLRSRLARLQEQHVTNGAVVVIDNRSGDVLALVGSENYFAPGAGQVNGAWAPRSAGSTFKPFTYLLALQHGDTPATVVADVPVEFVTANGLFRPVNYNHRCYGPMRYRLALANSLNISAVKVLEHSGGPAVLQELLQRCGLTTLNRPAEAYGLGLTIGNAEARLLELTNAYAALARLGEYRPCHLTLNPASATGSPATRIADPATAWLIANMLSDNNARVLAFGLDSALRWDFPVAAKTGTSSDYRDNWAFGFTPEFTVGVWTGNFDGTPMQGVSGVTGAAPVLHELFTWLHQRWGTTWYDQPTAIVQTSVDPVTGHRIASNIPNAVPEFFLKDHLPLLATPQDYDQDHHPVLSSDYAAWLKSGDNWLGSQVSWTGTATANRSPVPLPGTIYYLDPDLPASSRKIRLAMPGFRDPFWQCATLPLSQEDGVTFATLQPGHHELTVTDHRTGESRHTWIEIRAL